MGTLICPYFSIKCDPLLRITSCILMTGLEVNSYLQPLFLLPLPRSLPIISFAVGCNLAVQMYFF